MCDKDNQNEKTYILINVLKSARVNDLIGLICFKYTNEKKLPLLK
jgi:hypothetical protein